MKLLTLEQMNWDRNLRMIFIMMIVAVLVLVALPSYVSMQGNSTTGLLIGQIEGGAAESTSLALLNETLPLETSMVSWNS